MPTTACRDCQHEVSTAALSCPHCGAFYPFQAEWDGWGYEWKSKTTIAGLPLVHVAFKYRQNMRPVVAKGWIAIGQFSYGFLNISQFGLGPFAVSQFALAGAALSQISVAAVSVSQLTAAFYGVCQAGVVYDGFGMQILRIKDLL